VVIPPTEDDRREARAGQNAEMAEDTRSGEREPDNADIASDSRVIALFRRLVAAGDISAGEADLLAREWASYLEAERGESTCEREYWSLRLTRDLAHALGNQTLSVDPDLEHALDGLEEALVTGFVAGL
jgi:hypothetical protein